MVRKNSGVEYFEYRDGYAVSTQADVLAVLEGYRVKKAKRNELRLFAAKLEHQALHKKSKVDLDRILNCRSKTRGIRRLSPTEIARADQKLDSILLVKQEGPSCTVALSRRVLRHIAQGRCTANEAIVLLFYMLRRMKQTRSFEKLNKDERYARFTYSQLKAISGIPNANVSRAVSRLKQRGWLNTVPVHKQNENAYGQLFVDGALISLTGAHRPVEKTGLTEASIQRNNNAPSHETTTLTKNMYPKTKIRSVFEEVRDLRVSKWQRKADFERIKLRARRELMELSEQAA